MTKSKARLAAILNAAAEGKSQNKIAEESGASTATIWDVMKDYPLWEYFRRGSRKPQDD